MKRSELFAVKPMPEDSKDIESHYNLWRSVLDQAVQDYSYKGKSKDGLRQKEEVEQWLKDKYNEFEYICDLASVDHERARKEFDKYKEGEYDNNRKVFRTTKKSK
tara:strand:- start:480 stop:794 length:315 start_codon:yes stop_codon:yes gene_type:complete